MLQFRVPGQKRGDIPADHQKEESGTEIEGKITSVRLLTRLGHESQPERSERHLAREHSDEHDDIPQNH